MSRWSNADRKVARARIVDRYTDLTAGEYLRRVHQREWGCDDAA